jgi:16S rRNA C967 or C1407 C5-methylase (RsmB/RsmF family)
LKTTTAVLSEKFRQENVDFEILADETMLKIKGPQAIARLPGFAEGLFTVQDITASQAVKALKLASDATLRSTLRSTSRFRRSRTIGITLLSSKNC